MAYPFGTAVARSVASKRAPFEAGWWKRAWSALRRDSANDADRGPGRTKMLFEPLEPRLLLSADLSFLDNGNTDIDLRLAFDAAGAEYQLLTSTNQIVSSAAFADAANGGVVISGTSANDILSLDLTSLTSLTLTFLGDGVDTVKLTGDMDFQLSDTAIEAGVETFSLLGSAAGLSFENAEVTGGVSANSLITGGWSGTFSFHGGGGDDTLRGDDVANIWEVTAANEGTLNGNSFDNVENLVGGLVDDSFVLGASGSLTGTVEGGVNPGTPPATPAVDTLDYSASGSAVTVDLSANQATAIGGFSGVDAFVGRSGGGDTLVSSAQLNEFQILGAGSGTLGNYSFSQFENLTGASTEGSIFLFGQSGGLSGQITGVGSNDNFAVYDAASGDFIVYKPGGFNVSGSATLLGKTVNFVGMDDFQLLQGDDANREIKGTLFSDNVTLENDPSPGYMHVKFEGYKFFDPSTLVTTDVQVFKTPTESLTIELLGGSDQLTVNSVSADFAADLLLYGNHKGDPGAVEDPGIDTVTFAGSVSTGGGYLETFADHIVVADGVTLSARDAIDPTDANDIVFRARRLNVPQLENLSPLAFVQDKHVSVDIGTGATLTGGGVYLIAQGEDRSFSDINGIDNMVDQFVIGSVVSKLNDLTALPAKVLVRGATADVTVREGANLIGDYAVGVYASASTDSSGVAKSKLFSVAYGGATAKATVTGTIG